MLYLKLHVMNITLVEYIN